jgi:ATP-dependent DNA helicase RecQ
VSQWGHDFRPAYLKIAHIKAHFPKFLLALATATARVKEDIITQIGLEKPHLLQNHLLEKYCIHGFEVEDKLHRISQILNKKSTIFYYLRSK